jgi:DHA2 family multidrug resistance protein
MTAARPLPPGMRRTLLTVCAMAATIMQALATTLNMATDAGKALLDAIVTQQAVIIAYANDYKLLLVLALAAMPLVLFVGSSRAMRQPAKGTVHAMD